MYNFDSYNVLLSIATNISVLLMMYAPGTHMDKDIQLPLSKNNTETLKHDDKQDCDNMCSSSHLRYFY